MQKLSILFFGTSNLTQTIGSRCTRCMITSSSLAICDDDQSHTHSFCWCPLDVATSILTRGMVCSPPCAKSPCVRFALRASIYWVRKLLGLGNAWLCSKRANVFLKGSGRPLELRAYFARGSGEAICLPFLSVHVVYHVTVERLYLRLSHACRLHKWAS